MINVLDGLEISFYNNIEFYEREYLKYLFFCGFLNDCLSALWRFRNQKLFLTFGEMCLIITLSLQTFNYTEIYFLELIQNQIIVNRIVCYESILVL